MFHWLFHLDVYSSQQVDSVIPPNLKTAQQVGIALNRRNCPKHLDPKIFGTRSFERQTNSPFQQRCPPCVDGVVFFFGEQCVSPPPPIFGWKPPPASVSPPASVPLPPALLPLPLGPEPCVDVFWRGDENRHLQWEKVSQKCPLFIQQMGLDSPFYVRQKKKLHPMVNWEATFTPQTSDWLIMVCSVSYFTS